MELREYQKQAVDALWRAFAAGPGNPLLVLPTGAGKSLILAEIIRRALTEYPETRILVATHRSELIEQDARAIRSLFPSCDLGIFSVGLGLRQVRPVTVGGVQSLVNVDLPHTDIVLVDEAHLVPKEGDGMYRRLLSNLAAKNPKVRVVGLTATPYRLSGGRLTRGAGKLFHSIAFDLPVQQLVDEGYLSPLITPANIGPGFNTQHVTVRGGDYAPSELGASLEAQLEVTRAALKEAASLAHDRSSWLVFCVSIAHAHQAAAELFSLGIAAHVVTGDDDASTRKFKIDAYKSGAIRALISVDVLTTGFDAPRTDCIVLLRPTQSTGLYVQIVGRGMRLAPGKRDCIVLDYGGNIATHGPITAVAPKESKENVAKGCKVCPKCDAEVAQHKRECPECGYLFPRVPREVEHDKTASNRAIMGPAPEHEWVSVYGRTMERWEPRDENKRATVVVKYHTGNLAKRDHKEWICPEHDGYAYERFCRWWFKMGGNVPYPTTIDETLNRQDELREVEAITVEKDGQYDKITAHRLAPMREPGCDDVEEGEVDDVDLPGLTPDDGVVPW